MCLDEIDADPAAAGRVSHAKFEQGIDVAGFGVREPAADQEVRALLTNCPHLLSPQSPLCETEIDGRMTKKWLTRLNHEKQRLTRGCCRSAGSFRSSRPQSAASLPAPLPPARAFAHRPARDNRS